MSNVPNHLNPSAALSPFNLQKCHRRLGYEGKEISKAIKVLSELEADKENISPRSGSSPCSEAEYNSLRRQLIEKNTQRDELLTEVRTLMERNKQYKRYLEHEDQQKHQQLRVLQKSHATQVVEKDLLIVSLRTIIEELEEHIRSTTMAPSSDGEDSCRQPHQTHVVGLIDQIQRLLQEKADHTQQIVLQCPKEHCEPEHYDTLSSLQLTVDKLEGENRSLREDLDQLQRLPLYISEDSGNGFCSTDTEKQLEKMQKENSALHHTIEGLRSYALQSSFIGFNPENERMRLLEEENTHLRTQLDATRNNLSNKDSALRTLQMRYRDDISKLMSENRKIAKQMRELQYEIISLYAKEPDVLTRFQAVYVDLEAETPNTALVEAEIEQAALHAEVGKWQKLCENGELGVQDVTASIYNLKKQEEIGKSKQDEALLALPKKEEQNQLTESLLLERMSVLRQQNSYLCAGLTSLRQQWHILTCDYRALREEMNHFHQNSVETILAVKTKLMQAVLMFSKQHTDLVKKYHREMQIRKQYYNELVELKGNIRVFCRVRPCIREDGPDALSHIIVSYDSDDDGLIYVANKSRKQTFEVDRVFTETSTQVQVYDEVRALVTSCIDGYHVCLFAYGQTGSGKTFTMEGLPDNPGINQRALQELFWETANKGEDWDFTISVSVLEIYNESIRDLLNDANQEKLEVRINPDGGLHVPGLVRVIVETVEDVNKVLKQGNRNRTTATTYMNEHSSRSHALLCVTVTGINRVTKAKTVGKLNLVDLAGSERVSKSGADGARLKEAQNINRSLACLGDVIHALRTNQPHIPYRNSRLTYLLQDSLGGDSKTLMIVQVAPVEWHTSETVCSLLFAQRVRTVELGRATRLMETGDSEITSKSPGSPIASPTCRTPSSPLSATAGTHILSGSRGSTPLTFHGSNVSVSHSTPLPSQGNNTPVSRSTPLTSRGNKTPASRSTSARLLSKHK